MTVTIRQGDCREVLKTMPDESVHCVVTSPPYWGLRDYGVDGQLGMEKTYAEHVTTMVDVFREVRRVLRSDGTLWLNYGDSYATSVNGRSAADAKALGNDDRTFRDKPFSTIQGVLKPKDLCGIPWRVAFALQEDGWYLRQDIIWSKPNPMPESVTDRCTKAHEYIFLLSKSGRYYYDAKAIAETAMGGGKFNGSPSYAADDRNDAGRRDRNAAETRNRRSVWEVTTQPFPDAHFATFPPDLIEPCIKAGSPVSCCSECGAPATNETKMWKFTCRCAADFVPATILDPFGGAGTTGLVADRLGRNAILIELNSEYAEMARRRIAGDAGMFADVQA